MAHAIEYRRLRAPREHGQALIDPPLADAAETIAHNQQSLAAHDRILIGGLALGELRSLARAELFQSAWEYSSAYLQGGWQPAQPTGAFILSGHQPELFHPGVWFKNFVLSSLGQRLDATAINLVIDNDEAGASAVRRTTLVDQRPTAEMVWFDDPLPDRPYEERPLQNPELLASFPARLDPDGSRLVTRLWQFMRSGAPNLGQRLAAARHNLEAAHGLRTLEIPLSEVCDAPGFARFALHLLTDLARLHSIYNACRAEYRVVNRVRSAAHPVPPLAQQGARLEAPFWIWTYDRPQRRPLFAKMSPDRLSLYDDEGTLQAELPLEDGRVCDDTFAAWQIARRVGMKIRPRALVTTMYARLVLSDLFLHGIGGAKYDQLTDAIVERFLGVPPPRFLTVTATLELHPQYATDVRAQLTQVEHDLRARRFHPERYAVPTERAQPEYARLAAEKRALLAHPPPKGHRKAWHDALADVNARLLPLASSAEQRLSELRARLLHALPFHQLFGSREFSFCLFEPPLIDHLKRLAQHPARE